MNFPSKTALFAAPKVKKCTVTLYIPQDIFDLIENYKNTRGMFMSRFVQKVLTVYMADERIKHAICTMRQNPEFATKAHSFLLDNDVLDEVRRLRDQTGIPLSKLVTRCLVYGVRELERNVPLGTTILSALNKE